MINLETIEDILNSSIGYSPTKITDLTNLAIKAMDEDRPDDFNLIKDAFERLPMRPNTTRKIQFFGSRAFRMMYEDHTKVVIFHEKHGDVYYFVNGPEQFCKVFLKVFNERVTEGWYDGEEPTLDSDNDRVNARIAFDFLEDRSEYEYEGMTINYVQKM